jgi:hypothetical protein
MPLYDLYTTYLFEYRRRMQKWLYFSMNIRYIADSFNRAPVFRICGLEKDN